METIRIVDGLPSMPCTVGQKNCKASLPNIVHCIATKILVYGSHQSHCKNLLELKLIADLTDIDLVLQMMVMPIGYCYDSKTTLWIRTM
jgi:hypothetical protein